MDGADAPALPIRMDYRPTVLFHNRFRSSTGLRRPSNAGKEPATTVTEAKKPG